MVLQLDCALREQISLFFLQERIVLRSSLSEENRVNLVSGVVNEISRKEGLSFCFERRSLEDGRFQQKSVIRHQFANLHWFFWFHQCVALLVGFCWFIATCELLDGLLLSFLSSVLTEWGQIGSYLELELLLHAWTSVERWGGSRFILWFRVADLEGIRKKKILWLDQTWTNGWNIFLLFKFSTGFNLFFFLFFDHQLMFVCVARLAHPLAVSRWLANQSFASFNNFEVGDHQHSSRINTWEKRGKLTLP